MAGVVDIHYPYEDHKRIEVKPEGKDVPEWGGGSGAISFHSDDLYETLDVAYLTLSTVYDQGNTPTHFIYIPSLLKILKEEERHTLWQEEGIFISGRNVRGRKERRRPFVSYDNIFGWCFSFDFRICPEHGERMKGGSASGQKVIDKLRDYIASPPLMLFF